MYVHVIHFVSMQHIFRLDETMHLLKKMSRGGGVWGGWSPFVWLGLGLAATFFHLTAQDYQHFVCLESSWYIAPRELFFFMIVKENYLCFLCLIPTLYRLFPQPAQYC